jgi:hypothetical protein
MSTATVPTPVALPVTFHGDFVTPCFAAPAVPSPLESVQLALLTATNAALSNQPTAARLKKMTSGLAKVEADLAAVRGKSIAAQAALNAATDLGDVDAMLAARADKAAAEQRLEVGSEARDSLLRPVADVHREVGLLAERAANGARREQLEAAEARVERIRAKGQKMLGPQYLAELAEAAGF